jgi:hypothetical protein
MPPLVLPPQLATPVSIDGSVAAKMVLDLTVYLVGPSEEELKDLIALYETVCPKDRLKRYTTAEMLDWYYIARPLLTDSGKAAAAAGIKHPYFEPSFRRIRDGRGFVAGLWDGRSMEDPAGSWSFKCSGLLLEDDGLRSVVRILMPLDVEPGVLRKLAAGIADTARFHAGHGGLAFGYDPWEKLPAFDEIYALARRFWGVDIEDLNATLPFSADGIKGVNWLTLVGRPMMQESRIEGGVGALQGSAVTIDPHRHGVLLVAGPQPVVGDQNRPDRNLDPYLAVAKALEPVFLTEHPDFDGSKFIDNGNTLGWVRRFIEPDGWR